MHNGVSVHDTHACCAKDGFRRQNMRFGCTRARHRRLKLHGRYSRLLQRQPHGGFPTPLLLVLADLINVSQGRLGPLVSPEDNAIANAKKVGDSYRDRVRMTIRAYAANTVHRLIKSGQMRSNEEAYRRVADVLEKAGFRASGKRNPINSEVVRSWYEQALTEDWPFADEYQQALQGEDAEPAPLLDALRSAVQPLIFDRGSREQSS